MSRLSLVPTNTVALATAPTSAKTGDVYYDTTFNALQTFDGTYWQDTNSAIYSVNAATNLITTQNIVANMILQGHP